MPRQKTILKLNPNRCNRCGKCEPVCEPGALKVGASYIYVDWRTCNQCGKCIKVCEPRAIERKDAGVEKASTKAKASKAAGEAAAGGRASKASKRPKPDKAKKPAARSKKEVPQLTRDVPEWSILEALAMLAVVLAAFMLKDAVLNSEWALAMRPTTLVWLRVGVLAVFYAIQVGALWGLARYRGVELIAAMRMGSLGTPMGTKLFSVLWVAGLLLATRIAAWIYGVSAQAFGWDPPVRWNSSLTDIFGPDMIGLALSVLMVVLVGPVIEEMVFRGVLLPAFKTRIGMWGALLVSSALFAGYHFNAWLLIPAFILGMAAGWLALHRQSLWPAIVLHSLYNVVPVAMAFYIVS